MTRPSTPQPPAQPTTRRLALDIPTALHRAMKVKAAETGIPMVEEVTPLLLAHYATELQRFVDPTPAREPKSP